MQLKMTWEKCVRNRITTLTTWSNKQEEEEESEVEEEEMHAVLRFMNGNKNTILIAA